ncbi:hypothetical protein [Fictibacillus sp. NRS-1165]|uniref:hypothetical protein n=1 Tax=Fictibacillus sp. NRS-1165 TaxID=3144463 RepID=UPI003D21B35A
MGVLRNAQFIRAVVQQAADHVWNASLERVKGMLGMTFASSQKEKDCFLVWSAWQAELDDTIKQQEETIRVIEDWRVCSGEMRRKI